MGLLVSTMKLTPRSVSSAMNSSAPGIRCSSCTSTPSMSVRYAHSREPVCTVMAQASHPVRAPGLGEGPGSLRAALRGFDDDGRGLDDGDGQRTDLQAEVAHGFRAHKRHHSVRPALHLD